MKTGLGGRFYIALTLFGLIGQVAWVVENMYLNVFIYKMFNASAEDIIASAFPMAASAASVGVSLVAVLVLAAAAILMKPLFGRKETAV